MTTGTEPYVLWSTPAEDRRGTALVVALHGRGATERDFGGLGLADIVTFVGDVLAQTDIGPLTTR